MPNYQQLWAWVHQARAWLWEQFHAHGAFVGTGIGLLMVSLFVAACGVLGLKVGKLGDQDAWMFLAAVGGFTFLAWGLITFDPEAQSKAKQREQPPAPVCQPPTEEFARQAGEAFGGLSLLVRTDEDRRRVADVVAIAQFLRLGRDDHYDYINFFTHLQKFVNLPAHGELHVPCEDLWSELETAWRENRGKFDPPYLEGYLSGLIGLTRLAEGQTADAARKALEPLDRAEELIGGRGGKRISAISNARAACLALRGRDRGEPPQKRAGYSRQALKQFAEAGAIRNEHYRFYVNYAECATQLYWLWYAHKQEIGKKFRTELLEALNDVLQMPQYELRSNPAGVTGEEVFGLLFKTIQGALERAGRYARKLDRGGCAPLVELNRFYFLLALRTAAGCGDVKLDDFPALRVVWGNGDENSGDFCALNKLTAGWILVPLEEALRGWLTPGENHRDPKRVRRLVEGLPGVDNWVKENFLDAEYNKVLALLDTPHLCERCPGRSGPVPVAAGAGRAS